MYKQKSLIISNLLLFFIVLDFFLTFIIAFQQTSQSFQNNLVLAGPLLVSFGTIFIALIYLLMKIFYDLFFFKHDEKLRNLEKDKIVLLCFALIFSFIILIFFLTN